MRKQRNSIPLESVQLVIDAYLAGATTTALAKQYRVTDGTIGYLLEKQGIPRRTRAETNRMRAPFDDNDLIRLTDEAVLSQREIALYLAVSESTIVRAMSRLGLKSKRGHGSAMEKYPAWRGGVRIDDDGYVLIKSPDHPYKTKAGYVGQHRLVMEEKLGRFLLPNEVVHHRDSNHANNEPDNLELFQCNADHLKHELTGKTPNYSPHGLQRMRENAQRLNRQRYASNQKKQGTCVKL
jgi:hypothetical protein